MLVQRGKDDMVKVVNRLQLSLELAQGIYENLLIRGHIFVIFGTENTIINVVQFKPFKMYSVLHNLRGPADANKVFLINVPT